MRILIYGLNYAPELTGIGKYTGEWAEWMQGQGHEVRVVTAPPYYPAWQVFKGYRNRWYQQEQYGSVSVTRCPIWVPRQVSGLKRLIHLLSFALTSFPVVLWQGLRWQPDWIVVVSPTFFAVMGGWLTAVLSRAQSWLHIQDFEIEAAFDLKILPAAARPVALGFERWLLSRFDRVSTIAPHMLRQLEAKGVKSSRASLLPNWVDPEEIFPLDQVSPLRAELGIPADQIVALYSGNMGRKQELETVIAAAEYLVDQPRIRLILCGDGAVRDRLLSSTAGLSNVQLLPLQPRERFNELLNLADIHLLPQAADAAASVMPSKLTGIFACGGSVIATALPHSDLALTVEQGGGLICPPGDSQALAACIVGLADDQPKRQAIRQQARAYAVAMWSKQQVLSQFHDHLLGISSAALPDQDQSLVKI